MNSYKFYTKGIQKKVFWLLWTVSLHMFVPLVSQDESAHMHSLAIASTAGLYNMIKYLPRRSSEETS